MFRRRRDEKHQAIGDTSASSGGMGQGGTHNRQTFVRGTYISGSVVVALALVVALVWVATKAIDSRVLPEPTPTTVPTANATPTTPTSPPASGTSVPSGPAVGGRFPDDGLPDLVRWVVVFAVLVGVTLVVFRLLVETGVFDVHWLFNLGLASVIAIPTAFLSGWAVAAQFATIGMYGVGALVVAFVLGTLFWSIRPLGQGRQSAGRTVSRSATVGAAGEVGAPTLADAASAWRRYEIPMAAIDSPRKTLHLEEGYYDFRMGVRYSRLSLKVTVAGKKLHDGHALQFFTVPARRLHVKQGGDYVFEFRNDLRVPRTVWFECRRVFAAR